MLNIEHGNRLSTALDLKIKDINFDDGTIALCKTKSRKQQIIPLSKSISVVLKEYLAIRGGVPEDYVFCNVYGEKAAPRSYQDMVSSYNIKRGVNKTSIHLFRHTFAKQWILAGGDVFRLQKILGHSDLTVTREYVKIKKKKKGDLYGKRIDIKYASEEMGCHCSYEWL